MAELAAATGGTVDQCRTWLAHLNGCAHALPLPDGDEAVLRHLGAAFAQVARPVHFVEDPQHCPECADHEATLQHAAQTRLTREALGGTGWDPIVFCSAPGRAYFLPTLARFALLPDVLAREWYGVQLLGHLSYLSAENSFWRWCTPEQRAAVFDFLTHLAGTRQALVQRHHGLEHDLADALTVWQRHVP